MLGNALAVLRRKRPDPIHLDRLPAALRRECRDRALTALAARQHHDRRAGVADAAPVQEMQRLAIVQVADVRPLLAVQRAATRPVEQAGTLRGDLGQPRAVSGLDPSAECSGTWRR